MTKKKCVEKVGVNDFKDSLGRYRTSSLFYEYAVKGMSPKWTMQDQTRVVGEVTYPSLKVLYMEMDHIPYSEYEFAEIHFGSWDHWDRMSNDSNKNLVAMFTGWRLEMEVKLRASALKQIIKEGKTGGASSLAAAKYIAEKGYEKRAGRPTKASIAKETKVQSGIATALLEDAERIGLEDEPSKLH
jgi:hypothetical protein